MEKYLQRLAEERVIEEVDVALGYVDVVKMKQESDSIDEAVTAAFGAAIAIPARARPVTDAGIRPEARRRRQSILCVLSDPR